jgi:hypothetical protein
MNKGNIIRVHDPHYYQRKIWIGIFILTALIAIKWITIRIQTNHENTSDQPTTSAPFNMPICLDSVLTYKNPTETETGAELDVDESQWVMNVSIVQQDEWISVRGCYSPFNPTRVYFQVDILDYSMDETFTSISDFRKCLGRDLKYPSWILANYSFYQETGDGNGNANTNTTRPQSNSLVFSAPLLQEFTSYLEEKDQIVFMVNVFEALNNIDSCQRSG